MLGLIKEKNIVHNADASKSKVITGNFQEKSSNLNVNEIFTFLVQIFDEMDQELRTGKYYYIFNILFIIIINN